MSTRIDRQAGKYANAHGRKTRWRSIVTTLAAFVVFCTTYALILPAVTLQGKTYCALEEHLAHTDDCYEQVRTLTCPLSEEGHAHTDDCYETQQELICGTEESDGHVHGDDCYLEESVLICTSEDPDHIHGDSCFETQKVLSCGQEEQEAHHHTESCFETRQALVCGQEEQEPHQHAEDCYTITYDREKRICGREIHQHTLQCYSNPEADVESASDWEKTFDSAERTGNWAKDIVAIAQTQIGYTESTHNYTVLADGETQKGYTRYGDWYGDPYGDWCAMFCSFCIDYAGVKEYPLESNCDDWIQALRKQDAYLPADGSYTPKPGDLIFFDWDPFDPEEGQEARGVDHVGFVCEMIDATEKSPAQLRTIEGNRDNCVSDATYDLTDSRILGYGVMPESERGATIRCEGDGFGMELWYTGEAQIPAQAQLVAEELPKDSERYESGYQASLARLNSPLPLMFFRMFDVSILDGQAQVEPLAPVRIRVEIESGLIDPGVAVGALQLTDDGAELLTAGVEETQDGYDIISFERSGAWPVALYGINLLEATQDDTSYWQRVSSADDLTDGGQYMIVSGSGYALGAVDNAFAGVVPSADTLPVDGETYYQLSGDTNTDYFRWVYAAGNTFQNVGGGSGELTLSSSLPDSVQLQSNDAFQQAERVKLLWDGTDYLVCDSDGNFSTSVSSNGSGVTLYQQVPTPVQPLNTTNASGSQSGATKPDYPAYITPSGAMNGQTALDDVAGQYWSDPATSQLEGWFAGVKADDGKVLTDKSVLYGRDDYGAFATYKPNTFGVSLSALGQTYPLTAELDVKVPLDVVFVLDTSGSMIDTKVDNTTSANIMVEALNNIMDYILKLNEDNRVGVACFSGGGHKLLDLGHYEETNGEYFKEGIYTQNTVTLVRNDTVTRTDGAVGRYEFTQGWWGTYTQHGIATGAQLFLDKTDTTVTRTVTKEVAEGTITATYTAARRPIFILLSDGDPTYCTSAYNDVLGKGSTDYNIFGNGNSGYDNYGNPIAVSENNNKGVMGYYTILSAQYYKEQISQHYNTDAYFYSVGIGMNQTGSNSHSASVSGDDYKRAVLNPTPNNINDLASCSNGSSPRGSIRTYTDYTCRMLYRLLNGSYSSSTVTVSKYANNSGDEKTYGVPGLTYNTVPVIANPFQSTGYAYADGSYFNTQATVEGLTKAFQEAVDFTKDLTVYGFILKNNEPVKVSDTIGAGMEMKGNPVLRYGGVNYRPASSKTNGNVTTYYYSGTYQDPYSGMTVDLSKITAEVETVDGRQTVRLIVPDSQLPSYLPELDNVGNASFYYEALPARLIYQVGLTADSEKAVRALEITGGELTFYANEWQSTDANSDFYPTTRNPYYMDNTYSKDPLAKAENTTTTKTTAWEYDASCSAAHVKEHLGNNGKLTFSSEPHAPVRVKLQKVDSEGNSIYPKKAKFQLYKGERLVGVYENNLSGYLPIPTLMTGYTYRLQEVEAPYGYTMLETPITFTIDNNKKVTLTAPVDPHVTLIENGNSIVIRVSNDYDNRDVVVQKVWKGLGEGDTIPASAQFQLYVDGVASGAPVTCNEANGWRYTWENLPMLSLEDRHEIAYTVQELDVPDGYRTFYSTGENGELIVTNVREGTTAASVVKKWNGGEEASVRVELERNGKPTGQYATLSARNGWFYSWPALPKYDENGWIDYTVREIPVDGYTSEIRPWHTGDADGQIPLADTYSQSSSLTNGGTYLLMVNGQALTVNDTGTGLALISIDPQQDPVPASALWTVSGNSSYTLTSVSTGRKLTLDGDNYVALSTSGTAWSFSGGRMYVTKRAWFVSNDYNWTSTVSNGRLATTTRSGSAATITPYQRVYLSVTDTRKEGDSNYLLVNTKNTQAPPPLQLTFRKVKSGTTEVLHGATFVLYRETGAGSTLIPNTTDRYGEWVGSYTFLGSPWEISLDKDGVYYIVETEAPSGYLLLEEPIVFTVTTRNGVRTAAVNSHPNLPQGEEFTSMDIPNRYDVKVVLPSTGGRGVYPIYALGVLLLAGALYSALRMRRRREKRAR